VKFCERLFTCIGEAAFEIRIRNISIAAYGLCSIYSGWTVDICRCHNVHTDGQLQRADMTLVSPSQYAPRTLLSASVATMHMKRYFDGKLSCIDITSMRAAMAGLCKSNRANMASCAFRRSRRPPSCAYRTKLSYPIRSAP